MAAGLANANTPYVMNSLSPGGSLIAAELPLPNLAIPLAGGANWSQSVTAPIDWDQFNVRLDYNISHTETLMFRYTQDHWANNSPNSDSTLGLWGDDPYPALEGNWSQPSKQIVARLNSVIGNSMVNDLEFAYSNNRINVTAGGTNPGLLAQTTAAIPPVWPTTRPGRLQGRSAPALHPLTTSFGFGLGITDAPQPLLYNRRQIQQPRRNL